MKTAKQLFIEFCQQQLTETNECIVMLESPGNFTSLSKKKRACFLKSWHEKREEFKRALEEIQGIK